MVGGGLVVLSALGLLLGEARFEAGGRFEASVGQAPTGISTLPSGQAVTTEQTLVLMTAIPTLNLHWFGDGRDFNAVSATRILWRPVPMLGSRPLFLENLDAVHSMHPNRRTTVEFRLRGSYGEQDYIFLSCQFVYQPTLLFAITSLMVDGAVSLAWRSSRRTTWTLIAGAVHRRSINAASADITSSSTGTSLPFLLPTETAVHVAPSWRFALSRRAVLQFSAPIADYDIQGAQVRTAGDTLANTYQLGHVNFASIQPQLDSLVELSRTHQLHAMAGLSYAINFRNANSTGNWIPLASLALVEWRSRLV